VAPAQREAADTQSKRAKPSKEVTPCSPFSPYLSFKRSQESDPRERDAPLNTVWVLAFNLYNGVFGWRLRWATLDEALGLTCGVSNALSGYKSLLRLFTATDAGSSYKVAIFSSRGSPGFDLGVLPTTKCRSVFGKMRRGAQTFDAFIVNLGTDGVIKSFTDSQVSLFF
jgi:hypothetical protein